MANMNVTELASRAGALHRSAPSKASIKLNHQSAQFWKRTGLESVGAERVAPRAVARLCGGDGKHSALIRLYGLREIAAGLMIFSQGRKPAAGVWSRVAGDAIDLATIAAAAVHPKTNKAGVAFAAANVL